MTSLHYLIMFHYIVHILVQLVCYCEKIYTYLFVTRYFLIKEKLKTKDKKLLKLSDYKTIAIVIDF